jgi:hypothetical protein
MAAARPHLPHEADADEVAAHRQAETHRYTVSFPAHGHRESDPHYRAFEQFKRRTQGTKVWVCYVGARAGFDSCSKGPLEIHHAYIEFAVQNETDAGALHRDFPGIRADATQEEIDAWVESEENFRILCAFHHRGHGGAHTASHSDWEAQLYVPGLIT